MRFLLIATLTLPLIAQSKPDFSGTWKLKEAQPMRGTVFQIQHKEPHFKYSASGKQGFNATFDEAFEFTTDGKPPADASKLSVSGRWEDRTLVLTYYKDNKELMMFNFRVSADGKQMMREADLSNNRRIRETYDRQ